MKRADRAKPRNKERRQQHGEHECGRDKLAPPQRAGVIDQSSHFPEAVAPVLTRELRQRGPHKVGRLNCRREVDLSTRLAQPYVHLVVLVDREIGTHAAQLAKGVGPPRAEIDGINPSWAGRVAIAGVACRERRGYRSRDGAAHCVSASGTLDPADVCRPRRLEQSHAFGDVVGSVSRVGVHPHQIGTARFREAAIERPGLEPVGIGDQSDSRIAGRNVANDPGGTVLAVAIEYETLHLAVRQDICKDRLEACTDPRCFIAHRDDHGHKGGRVRFSNHRCAFDLPGGRRMGRGEWMGPYAGGGMKVTYLYNIEGWAIHDVGKWVQTTLAPRGISVHCQLSADWHANPQPADVVHIGYSAMYRPWFDYRRWAGRVTLTIHDPCEVSHFEDRASWQRWPLRSLRFEQVDAISVISDELAELFHTRYGRGVIRTATWPSRADAIRLTGQLRSPGREVRLFASTNAEAHYAPQDMLERLRRVRTYLFDEHDRLAPRQLLGLGVRRRRKNIPLLREVAQFAAAMSGAEVDLTVGRSALRTRDAYERALAGCTVYACTSTMEGGPLPVMEAVLAGAAVLSTPVGQVAEWVEDGRNGWICRDLRDFRRALHEYARNPNQLVAHQRASMEIAAAKAPPSADGWYRLVTGEG